MIDPTTPRDVVAAAIGECFHDLPADFADYEAADNVIKALLAAGHLNEWREIDDDAKHYASVLLTNGTKVWEDWRAELGNGDGDCWMYDDNWAGHVKATHYQPLPKPLGDDDGR